MCNIPLMISKDVSMSRQYVSLISNTRLSLIFKVYVSVRTAIDLSLVLNYKSLIVQSCCMLSVDLSCYH